MKTRTQRNWYKEDLECYTPEFLQEIILDLLEDVEEFKKIIGD